MLQSDWIARILAMWYSYFILSVLCQTLSSLQKGRVPRLACGVIVATILKRRANRCKNRAVLVREWVKNRDTYGVYQHFLKELRLGDATTYRNFLRMDSATSDLLLNLVAPKITFRDTYLRKSIPPGERLALTLRFLATGTGTV